MSDQQGQAKLQVVGELQPSVALAPDPKGYEEVMISCLQNCDFRKKEAIHMFRMHFGYHLDWVTKYSYRVYERVLKKLNIEDVSKTLLTETIQNTRAMMEKAVQAGDFNAYEKMVSIVLRMQEKQDINLTQNNYNMMTKAPEEIQAEINELRKRLQPITNAGNAAGITSASAVGANFQIQPTVDVPVSPQAMDGTQQPS